MAVVWFNTNEEDDLKIVFERLYQQISEIVDNPEQDLTLKVNKRDYEHEKEILNKEDKKMEKGN
ncbi:MAG: hypothetical protein ACOCP8_02445 [archaeon]